MKRCTVLSHVAFEDLGLLEPILKDRGFALDTVDVPSQGVPEGGADLWVILGGPVGVYDYPAYPFLAAELDAVKSRLSAGAPTLGLCLGAQLMAAALGGAVAANPKGKEIGWSQLTLTPQGLAGPLRHLDGIEVLHWHGDVIALPDGVPNLASTAITPCQAFAHGPSALGLQFHPEVGASGLERWLVGHAAELSAAGIDVSALRAANIRHAPALVSAVSAMARDWLSAAGL